MSFRSVPPPPVLPLRFLSPPPVLRQQVQAIWCLDTRRAAMTAGTRDDWQGGWQEDRAFMHPDGGTGFLLNLGRPLPPRGPGEGPLGWLGWEGVQSVSGTLIPETGWLSYGVRFHPGGARRFWDGLPMLQTSTEALEALHGNPLRRLYQRLGEAQDTDTGLGYFAQWLAERLTQRSADGVVPRRQVTAEDAGRHALAAVMAAVSKAGSVAEAATQLHVSRRALERRFADHVGVSPKQYARIQRIAEARALLKRAPLATQAELAQQLGYFDEAHFIRDFRAMVGLTPGQYARRRSPFPAAARLALA
ncbi:helix-turn-helix transcriptional regulator [Alcanivorax sp. JB21]|uniref:helix-turn-helix transcriptional regulator n=1 Tax=Alcanivorax limicola TaxID=2874102 RepID=UPI001CBFBA83|nr:helix-turn-helix transcriptional regulator [Alcanivorax limicola]MBZ2190402.1 helix-turn-helix transcriptional regulator [Alcanivorax limicola]